MADRYCTECGAPLEASDKFCPACGAEMKDVDDYSAPQSAAAPGAHAYGADSRYRSEMAGRLQMLSILTIVWGAVALFMAVSVLSSVDAAVDMMIDELKKTSYEGYENMWAYLQTQGITADTFKNVLWTMGGTFAASGVCGLAAGFLMMKKQRYTLAMIFLVVCILTSAIGVFTLIVGVIIFIMFTRTKEVFES